MSSIRVKVNEEPTSLYHIQGLFDDPLSLNLSHNVIVTSLFVNGEQQEIMIHPAWNS